MKHESIYDNNNNNNDDNKQTLEDVLPLKTNESLVEFERRFINEEWISPALVSIVMSVITTVNIYNLFIIFVEKIVYYFN